MTTTPAWPPLAIETPATAVADAKRAELATLWIFIAWLSTYVLEGPLRGALFLVGQPNLLYFRDLVSSGTVFVTLLAPLLTRRPAPPGLVVACWLLAVHVSIGLLLGGTLFQRLFGIKIFMAVLYTLAIFPIVQRHFALFTRTLAVFFGLSVLGVLVNKAIGTMPWEGLNYDTAFGAVDTTRQWWMAGGVRRLPGFARASFDAAMIVGVTGAVLLPATRSLLLRAAIGAAGLVAIALTTSKGMLLAYALAVLWLGFARPSPSGLKLGRAVVVLLLALTCLLPTLFMVISVPEHPTDMPALLSSMWDRFAWMWPNGYELVPDGFGALTGAGPGGIGTALENPDARQVPNSADSIFVYFYVSFGLMGLAYLAFPAWAVLRPHARDDPQARVWAALLTIAYGYGLSINMIEQAFFAAFFGLLCGAALAPRAEVGADA